MDIVAAEKELRSSTSFDDIHLLWDELFGVTGYNFALFSQGAEFADRVMSETDKNVVSLFQLKSFYFSLPRAIRDELMQSSEYHDILTMAESVSESAVKKFVEESGSNLISEKYPNFFSDLEKLKDVSKVLLDIRREIDRNATYWYDLGKSEIQKQMNADEELINLLKKQKAFQERIKASDTFTDEDHEENMHLYAQISKRYDEIRDVVWEDIGKKEREAMSRLQEQRDRLYAETEELQTALLNSLKDVLKEHSPISAEEAQEWVEKSVFFDSSATAKMSRLGVSIPQFKESLAELYRYLGGKLGIIHFVVEGRSKRAFARGRGLIALQGAINTETLFHECGHLAEAWDQAINAACLRFVKDRAEGPPVSLRKLTGNHGYRLAEVAYPDSFIDPYVGKHYSHAASEVLSMGIQCLANGASLRSVAKDSEHLKLMVGICTMPRRPDMAELVQKAQQAAASEQLKKDLAAKWNKALGRVANKAFSERLLDSGIRGYRMYHIFDSYELYDPENNLIYATRYGGNLKQFLRVAYLYIANAADLLPGKFNSLDEIKNAAEPESNFIPSWFDNSSSLPRIQ